MGGRRGAGDVPLCGVGRRHDALCVQRHDHEWRYDMTQQWNWLRRPMLPALPPPRLTADIYETLAGEAYVIEIPIPGLTPEEIVIDVTSDSLTVSTRPQQAESKS